MNNMIKTIKEFFNSKLNIVRFSAQVFVIGTILSMTLLFLLIDISKEYRSEIIILVNVKSKITEKQADQMINNIIEIPKTLSFYDRLLKFNPDVRDVFAGLEADERKEGWNEIFSIKRAEENSAVFKVSIETKLEADSKQLATKTVRTLFDTTAFYYDVKNDVDLRIIDGVVSKTHVPSMFWLVLLSVVGGFASAVLLDFIFMVGESRLRESSEMLKKNHFFDFKKKDEIPAEKEMESLKNLYSVEQTEAPFVFEKETVKEKTAEDQAFQEMKKLTKKFESSKYPNYSEMPILENHQTSSAPDNLPIADESFLAQYQNPEEVVKIQTELVIEEKPIIDTKKEPTPEELKKRLNQLLRGEL